MIVYVAFDEFKEKLYSPLVLNFFELEKPFKVHTNANNFTIGRMFMQDGRPIVFYRKKLDGIQTKWPMHEKKIFATVHCFKTFQHSLGLYNSKVSINNLSLNYLDNQSLVLAK